MVSRQWLVEVASAGWILIDFDPIASLLPLSEDLPLLLPGHRVEYSHSWLLHWSIIPATCRG